MSFQSVLKSIVHECGGGLSIALVGNDGIAIVQVHEVPGDRNPLGGDLTVPGAAFGRTLNEIHLLASAYGWSEGEILSLTAKRRRLYLQMVLQ